MIFRLLWPPTLLLGRAQSSLAKGFREGNTVERVCIFPTWAVTRLVFIGLLTVCEVVV